MNPMEELRRINSSFQELLATGEQADITPSHRSDDLMVWILLGGKDVGKSTFLNSLLGVPVSDIPSESAEGTFEFQIYIHQASVQEFQERLAEVPVRVRFHPHESERHRRLCLIDSPDFDSRYERHAAQVNQVLESGATDGAVLLASPEKYKNQQYWRAFAQLSHTLSTRHILFVLTKADELGEYLEDVRKDFKETVTRRLASGRPGDEDGTPTLDGSSVYLIDSLNKGEDFPALEGRLLRKLSSRDVRKAQEDNLRQALSQGVERVRDHYQLDRMDALLRDAADPQRLEDIWEDTFPESYFHMLAARLSENRDVSATVRERLWQRPGGTLAGIPAFLSVGQWFSARNPFRLRTRDSAPPGRGNAGEFLEELTRWGDESLGKRLANAQREVVSGVVLEDPRAMEPFLEEGDSSLAGLAGHLEDLVARPCARFFAAPVRWLLNLPVYLYLMFFVFLLLSPLFLLLKAWGTPYMPDYTGILTLDNVKVAVIGFAGYYLMALFYVVRKHRELVRHEMHELSRRYAGDMRLLLRQEIARPLEAFQEKYAGLQSQLARIVLIQA